jgi:hypothetical protein
VIDAGRKIDTPFHTIDTFEAAPWIERRLGRQLSREAFDRYTGHIDDLVVHEGFAPDVVRDTWHEPIGFYFDDATHGDPGWSDNFEFFSQFFNDDAIVCGDDFAGGWPDVTRNVSRIAREWGVGVYVFGRVWAMTRADEGRIVSAATTAEPALDGITLESAHGPQTATGPAMCWSHGLHQRVPLSSFRISGDAAAGIGFTAHAHRSSTSYGPDEWVHIPGVTGLSISGPPDVGFQLCFAREGRTDNTKLYRSGDLCRIEPGALPVAVRLGMV